LAINLGAFGTPLVCADLIGQRYGYRWEILAALAGMAVAAVLFP
jgi:POT family proton-dependent oligopeptide transporter